MTGSEVIARFFLNLAGESKYLKSIVLEQSNSDTQVTKLVRSDQMVSALHIKYRGSTLIFSFENYCHLDMGSNRKFVNGKLTKHFYTLLDKASVHKIFHSVFNTKDVIRLVAAHTIGDTNSSTLLQIGTLIKLYESVTYDCGHTASSEYLHKFGAVDVPVFENGIVVTDSNGIPIFAKKKLCEKCASEHRSQDIERPNNMHRTGYLVPKVSPTFNKWPFTSMLGLELELIKVLPIKRDALDSKLIYLMYDQSIKLSGHNLSNQAVTVPIPETSNSFGIEVATHPMNGDLFYDTLTKAMSVLTPATLVNKSCALHVHVDWSGFTDKQKIVAQYFLQSIDRVLYAIQPKTRFTNSFAKPVNAQDLMDSTKNFDMYPSWEIGDRYDGISFVHAATPNIRGVGDKLNYGTVEFRMSAGSRNLKKILMWSQLISRIMEVAETITFTESKFLAKLAVEGSYKTLINAVFTLFKHKDAALNRPSEFLDDLKTWYLERIAKFKTIVPSLEWEEVVLPTPPVKVPTILNNAKLVQVEDFVSVYEKLEGLEGA